MTGLAPQIAPRYAELELEARLELEFELKLKHTHLDSGFRARKKKREGETKGRERSRSSAARRTRRGHLMAAHVRPRRAVLSTRLSMAIPSCSLCSLSLSLSLECESGVPLRLAVAINHYGSLFMPTPLELPGEGRQLLEVEALEDGLERGLDVHDVDLGALQIGVHHVLAAARVRFAPRRREG